MNGRELSRAYFETFGMTMLRSQFPDLIPFLAAGLLGSGSEILGYDDEISRDHDFEPGFCLFLPGEEVVSRRRAFELERAYAKLPKEFRGYTRALMQPVGGARKGVIRLTEFLAEKIGSEDGTLSISGWLNVPEQALLELTEGEVYFDHFGALKAARAALAYYPEDIRRKKLAGQLLTAAQAGQYNYMRCISHGEAAAAQLAVFEFVKAASSVIFLLNRRYQPYYKWSFRALRTLPLLSIEAELFEYLLTTDNSKEMCEEKYRVIEGIAVDLIELLMEQGITKANCGDLEKHAYSVNDSIENAEIRNLHILSAI